MQYSWWRVRGGGSRWMKGIGGGKRSDRRQCDLAGCGTRRRVKYQARPRYTVRIRDLILNMFIGVHELKADRQRVKVSVILTWIIRKRASAATIAVCFVTKLSLAASA